MLNKMSFLVLVLACFLPTSALAQQSLDALIARELNSLVETYKTLHATPELSIAKRKPQPSLQVNFGTWDLR